MVRERARNISTILPQFDFSESPLVSEFPSRQVVSRAVKKAEKGLYNNLPRDENFKVEVMRKVIERVAPKVFEENQIAKRKIKRPRKDFEQKVQAAIRFYECDLISRQDPGRDDFVSISIDNQVEHIQTFTLQVSLHTAWENFNELFPDLKISFAKFCKVRPKHVKLFSEAKQLTCLCQICENLNLILKALHEFMVVKYSKESLLKLFSCNPNNKECAFDECVNENGKCLNLNYDFKKLLRSCSEDEMVNLRMWEKNGFFYDQKVVGKFKVSEVVTKFLEHFKIYKKHIFIAHTQKEFQSRAIENLNDTEGVMTVDFAEKYTTNCSREIQSAYFNKKQITLFTIKVHIGSVDYSYVIASDDSRQSKEVVFTFLKKISKELKILHPNLSHVKVFSDGAASQFKNKFTISNLMYAETDFGFTMEWNFFGSGHGKSACDGIGGAIKRKIHRNAIAGEIHVYSAKEFAECAAKFSGKIKVLEVNSQEIDSSTRAITKRWEKVKSMPGIRSFHHFHVSQDSNSIQASHTSLCTIYKNF